MSEVLMDFDRFDYIMTILEEFSKKRERVSEFFEKELTTSTWCIFDYGDELETCVINMLADEFNCWFSIREGDKREWWAHKYRLQENDIAYYLYEIDGEHKDIVVDGVSYPINTHKEFYDYLVKFYKQQS